MRRGLAMAALVLAGPAVAGPAGTAPPRAAEGSPQAAAPAPKTPAQLRDLFQKADKALRRAGDAARGDDPGRVALLLRRADEEIDRFATTSGLGPLNEAVVSSREEASGRDLAAAEISLRRARPWIASLSDYTVPRSAEVAFREAQAAAADDHPDDFLSALDRFEAATLATVLLARLRETREAVARARTLLVRGDLPGGRKEIDAALSGLGGLTYLGALSRSRFGLLVASELLRENASLAARDQAQKGLRDLRLAIPLAPESARDALIHAQEEATAVWKRINRPAPGDADLLAAASKAVEESRQQLRGLRPADLVAE